MPTDKRQPSLVQLVQAALNQTRRIDAKYERLKTDLRNKHACWERHVASLKEAFKVEKQRYQKDVKRIEEELTAVAEQQAAAHHQLSGIIPGGATAAAMDVEDDWEQLIGTGLAQQKEGYNPLKELGRLMSMARAADPPPALLADASSTQAPVGLAAPVTPPHRSPQRPPLTPPSTTAPPAMVDPYIFSPSTATHASTLSAGSLNLGATGTIEPDPTKVSPVHARLSPGGHTGQRPVNKARQPTSVEAPRPSIKEAAKATTNAEPPPEHPIASKLAQKREELKAALAQAAAAEVSETDGGLGPKEISLIDDDHEEDDLSPFDSDGELRTME